MTSSIPRTSARGRASLPNEIAAAIPPNPPLPAKEHSLPQTRSGDQYLREVVQNVICRPAELSQSASCYPTVEQTPKTVTGKRSRQSPTRSPEPRKRAAHASPSVSSREVTPDTIDSPFPATPDSQWSMPTQDSPSPELFPLSDIESVDGSPSPRPVEDDSSFEEYASPPTSSPFISASCPHSPGTQQPPSAPVHRLIVSSRDDRDADEIMRQHELDLKRLQVDLSCVKDPSLRKFLDREAHHCATLFLVESRESAVLIRSLKDQKMLLNREEGKTRFWCKPKPRTGRVEIYKNPQVPIKRHIVPAGLGVSVETWKEMAERLCRYSAEMAFVYQGSMFATAAVLREVAPYPCTPPAFFNIRRKVKEWTGSFCFGIYRRQMKAWSKTFYQFNKAAVDEILQDPENKASYQILPALLRSEFTEAAFSFCYKPITPYLKWRDNFSGKANASRFAYAQRIFVNVVRMHLFALASQDRVPGLRAFTVIKDGVAVVGSEAELLFLDRLCTAAGFAAVSCASFVFNDRCRLPRSVRSRVVFVRRSENEHLMLDF